MLTLNGSYYSLPFHRTYYNYPFIELTTPKSFGTLKELVTDNVPEFASHYFKSFSRAWCFEHQTISPHFQQLNELTERAIQTIKLTHKKAKLANEDHYLSILFLSSQVFE